MPITQSAFCSQPDLYARMPSEGALVGAVGGKERHQGETSEPKEWAKRLPC